MLAKQFWRLHCRRDSLLARTLKARCFRIVIFGPLKLVFAPATVGIVFGDLAKF